uniref:Uncharacterized protein n=1 Tax=Poecilia latipinna TaxID=48699 RepID=A0A3B3V6K8_9TELE
MLSNVPARELNLKRVLIFHHYGEPKHSSKSAKEWLRQKKIKVLFKLLSLNATLTGSSSNVKSLQ